MHEKRLTADIFKIKIINIMIYFKKKVAHNKKNFGE